MASGLELEGDIRAAGGIPWRHSDGELEVLLIHRPQRDDWTFPKGKLKDGESHEEAALREVEEETGLSCELGVELISTQRTDSNDRTKVVRYWAMRPLAGEAHARNEVDEIAWLKRDEAYVRLTYNRDRDVLDSLRQ